MIPDPTTIARRNAVPSASAAVRRKMSSCIVAPSESASAAIGLAAPAAVFPQIIGEPAKRAVIGRVIVKRPLEAHDEEPCVDEPSQMVAQRGSRQVDVGLDVAGNGAPVASLHDETEHRQANRMAEGTELRGMAVEFGRQRLILTNSK
jgi:hypothetical protein